MQSIDWPWQRVRDQHAWLLSGRIPVFPELPPLGSSVLVCDGKRWNGTVPSCVQDIPLTPGNPPQVPGDSAGAITVREGTTCGQAPWVRNAQLGYSSELDSLGATYWVVDYTCNTGFRLLRSGRLSSARAVSGLVNVRSVSVCTLYWWWWWWWWYGPNILQIYLPTYLPICTYLLTYLPTYVHIYIPT